MLPLDTKLSRGKLLPQSDLCDGLFLEEMSCRCYDEKERKEQKNEVSVLGISEVRWKGQGEIRSGDYTVYYSGVEQAERRVAIVVHKSIVRSVVKKIFVMTESLLLSKRWNR